MGVDNGDMGSSSAVRCCAYLYDRGSNRRGGVDERDWGTIQAVSSNTQSL